MGAAARLIGVAAIALAAASCGAVPAAPATSGGTPGPVLTEADSGRTVSLPAGGRATLRLSDRHVWSEPRISGGAIRLTPAAPAAGSGQREWEISASGRGSATITAEGRPACTPGQLCPGAVLAFSLTVVVT